MRSAIPALAELEAPLRKMLEEWTKRTRHVADRRMLTKGDSTAYHAMAWGLVRKRVAQAGLAYRRKEGYRVLVLADASDLYKLHC